MRVLLDTNILISHLYSSSPTTSSIGVILQAAVDGAYTLLLVEDVVDEMFQKLNRRTDLARRIARLDAEELIESLRLLSRPVSRLTGPYSPIGRDRKDDFLIAHGVFAAADYLISWDRDLLVLDAVGSMRIVDPPRFLDILRDGGLLALRPLCT